MLTIAFRSNLHNYHWGDSYLNGSIAKVPEMAGFT